MKFIEDYQPISDDLPWANEYISSGIGEVNDISQVNELIFTTKGILVLTDLFKGFIFSKSKTYQYIQEAKKFWGENSDPGYSLFAKVESSGKISIAVDTDTFSTFYLESNKKVIIKSKKEKEDLSTGEISNPFIPQGSPVPTTRGKQKKE